MESEMKAMKSEVTSGLRKAKTLEVGELEIWLKKARPLFKRARMARKANPIVVIQMTRGGNQMTIIETVDVSMEAKQPKS